MKKNDLLENYKISRPLYDNYTTKLKSLIIELVKEQKIEFHLIESRTKTIDSFQEKIKRKTDKYQNLEEITDLSALRIIVYYPTDIKKIENLIDKEFIVDKENSVVSGEELKTNEFGYLSSHLIFSLANNRNNLSEWKYYDKFKCEIQIRTVLQHAWASISHSLQYKTKTDIPSNLQRKLFRLAGLFELADEQFVDIKKVHESLISEIKSEDIKVSDRELNMLTISNFIENSEIVNNVYSIALRSGFIDQNEEPNLEHNDVESTSELIRYSKFLNINTISELDKCLKSIKKNELKLVFTDQIIKDRDSESEWYSDPSFIIHLILTYINLEKVNAEKLAEFGWYKPLAKRVISTMKETKKTIHNNV